MFGSLRQQQNRLKHLHGTGRLSLKNHADDGRPHAVRSTLAPEFVELLVAAKVDDAVCEVAEASGPA